tara:strand:+ start:8995 stop:9549 length:555 start_codon:yes stop_codon:yes gene_type:complete
MSIEDFISQSEGEWESMRSGHSLTFKQFEEIVSKITIIILSKGDRRVLELIKNNSNQDSKKITSPFLIRWKSQSNWEENSSLKNNSGSCLLIPIPKSDNHGIMLRSMGYAEQIQALSNYHFLSDGTLILSTEYYSSIAEERIWFLSKNVRCRSSVIRSINSSAILQTSHASEVRRLLKKNENRS